MKKLIRKMYNKGIKRILPASFRMWLKQKDTETYPIIINPSEHFRLVYHIKDATWETFDMPDIYQMRKGLKGSLYHKAQDILHINEECLQAANSDAIRTSKGVIWDKYYEDVFPYMIPMDEDVVEYQNDVISLRKATKEIYVDDVCVSLFGTFSTVWSHFLVQFLPKLYYAEEAGLLDKEITVLLPDIKDSHVERLVNNVIARHPQLRIVRDYLCDYRKVYRCRELYYIPTSSLISNDYIFPSMLHYVIPIRVIDLLKKNVVAPEVNMVGRDSSKERKIYLVRRSFRVPTDIEKIEEFFRNEGFEFVEPHKLSFEEKVKVFYEASIIVGPHSSAWSNLIFANNPKCLMFMSTNWIDDMYCGYWNMNFYYTLLQVTGNAEGKFDDIHYDHHNYDLTLEKVKNAYYELLQLK